MLMLLLQNKSNLKEYITVDFIYMKIFIVIAKLIIYKRTTSIAENYCELLLLS